MSMNRTEPTIIDYLYLAEVAIEKRRLDSALKFIGHARRMLTDDVPEIIEIEATEPIRGAGGAL